MMARTLAVVAIILTAALSRLLPHPMNVTPIMAMALFGGAHLRNRTLALIIPLAAMFCSDLVLAVKPYGWQSFYNIPFVYPCFMFSVVLGWWIRRKNLRPGIITIATLLSSLLFFVVTNFGCWVQGFYIKPAWYPLTLDGLITCYIAGIRPFEGAPLGLLANSLLGDLGFTVILFGGFWLGERILSPEEEGSAVRVPVYADELRAK